MYRNLTEEDLDAIGVTLAGHRKRLLMKANSYAGVNFYAPSGAANSPERARQSTEEVPQIAPPSQTETSLSVNVDSLDDVLGELQAFSAVRLMHSVLIVMVLCMFGVVIAGCHWSELLTGEVT